MANIAIWLAKVGTVNLEHKSDFKEAMEKAHEVFYPMEEECSFKHGKRKVRTLERRENYPGISVQELEDYMSVVDQMCDETPW